jgi:hypothetical protein
MSRGFCLQMGVILNTQDLVRIFISVVGANGIGACKGERGRGAPVVLDLGNRSFDHFGGEYRTGKTKREKGSGQDFGV